MQTTLDLRRKLAILPRRRSVIPAEVADLQPQDGSPSGACGSIHARVALQARYTSYLRGGDERVELLADLASEGCVVHQHAGLDVAVLSPLGEVR